MAIHRLPFAIPDVNLEHPGSRKGLAHWYAIEGEKYNRVTTILDKTIPKPGLLIWSRRTALTHVAQMVDNHKGRLSKRDLRVYLGDADVEPDRVKDDAADWGTRAHNAIQTDVEALIQNIPPPTYAPDMDAVVNGFREFTKGRGLTWFASELTVWIPHWKVAGTMDAVALDTDGKWIIMDWKTSKGFYQEQAAQLGAYAEGFAHITGASPGGAGIVRYPKEFDPEPWFDVAWVRDIDAQRAHYGRLVEMFQFLKEKTWKEKADA